QPATLQLGFHRTLLGVPVGEGVRDVIDSWAGRLIASLNAAVTVASNEDVIAKHQTALMSVVPHDLHPEQTCIEIARFPVIGYLVRHVVEGGHLEDLPVSCGGRRARVRRCRCYQRQALNELPPSHLSMFE